MTGENCISGIDLSKHILLLEKIGSVQLVNVNHSVTARQVILLIGKFDPNKNAIFKIIHNW